MPRELPLKVETVSDLDDPRLADYRNLRDRSLERREVFVAESEVVLRVLIARRTHPVRSVLLAERKVGGLAPLLAELPRGVPIYSAPQAALDRVTGFHLHRGVLAAAERVPVPDANALLAGLPPGPATVVALEGLTNHDNVGAVFRNAVALAADAVILDAFSCDPLYRKAIRVSVGACLVLAYARCPTLSTLVPALRRAGFAVWALTPNEPARDVTSLCGMRPQRVALLLGSEGPGLSAPVLAMADERVRIAQRASFDSLNVATACAIALHELSRGRPTDRPVR